VSKIIDALDEAFYASFANVEPCRKPVLLALDVSGSMGWSRIAGSCLTAREASAAMALITAATEKDYHIMAFSNRFMPVTISSRMRLDDVVRAIGNLPFMGTDCALPMTWAQRNKLKVSAFVAYTDSETWAGNIHPAQALQAYRKQFVPDAKAVVVGMTSNGFTLADPNDRGMLDVVGFDATAPAVIADFIRN
jgi:60 kDa SS-A/Ro ribonucleoprotein